MKKDRKKLLQINAVYGVGSTGEIVKGISDAAQNNGWDSYVACPNMSSVNYDKFILIGNNFDHKYHALFSRVFGKQGYASIFATKKLLKRIDAIKPDIIQLHNLHSNYINLPILFRYIKKNKIQTVITLHDCWFLTGKCCHFLDIGCEKWKTECNNCPKIKDEFTSYFFDKTKEVFHEKENYIGNNEYVHIVGCSKWVTDVCKKSILKSRVFGTINNGIDLTVFKPKNSAKKEELNLGNKYVVLGMANKWLDPENKTAFDYFVNHLEKDDVLMLVGCKEEQIEDLPKNVIGIGFIKDREELAEYYSISDVFVNLTRVDTFPTVNIESLACGTPVITYNSGGSAEIVSDETGLVIDTGDYVGALKGINKFRENKGIVSNNCIKRANEFYNRLSCYDKYIDSYNELLRNVEQ